MEKMNEKKISAKVLQSKSVKEYVQFAATALNDVLAPARMVDKVARVLSNPEFFAAEEPLEWLMQQIEAIVVDHVSSNVKDPLTRVQLAFDVASLANLTASDILPSTDLKDVSDKDPANE